MGCGSVVWECWDGFDRERCRYVMGCLICCRVAYHTQGWSEMRRVNIGGSCVLLDIERVEGGGWIGIT